MRKGWMIISVIVLIAVLVGTVGVGVGMITGADIERIYSVLDGRYHLDMYMDVYMQYFGELSETLISAFTV